MAIAASELILNSRSAIYHLDLRPEELADTIITVGDPGRVATVSQHFDRLEHSSEHREFITHTGYLGKKRISVVSTGIGPDNIDIVFNELDALANIDFDLREPKASQKSLNIIRLGTSGALQADIPLDSVVASSFAIGLDNLMHYYQTDANPEERYILEEFKQHTRLNSVPVVPYIAEGSIRLRSAFADKTINGITITCPGFYGPQGRVLRARLAFPNLIDALSAFTSRGQRCTNFEMESSAIYGLGKLLGHQCLSLSCIIANRSLGTFSKDGAQAVENMIVAALEQIETL
ncbi:MAG: nucleoside phosphorylase [Bacteroidetes bacterium]|nr:nucleoside phosphorylase [Bacteroidota bacterium]